MSDRDHLGEDLALLTLGGAQLGKERHAEIERHLASCPECRNALADAKKIVAAFAELPAVEPSVGFDRALMAKLDGLDAKAAGSIWVRLRGYLTPRNLAGATFAAAAVAAAIALIPPNEPADPPPEIASDALLGAESGIEIATNLDLLRDLDVIDNLDVADDLELIAELDEGEPG